MCFLSVFLFLAAFSFRVYFKTSANFTESECSMALKILYSVSYLAFLVFDVYQLWKLEVMTERTKLFYVAAFLLVSRVLSYGYNVFTVSALADKADGTRGFCSTYFPGASVIQEHSISIVYAVVLCINLITYVSKMREKMSNGGTVPLPELLERVVDTELLSFIFYLLCECVYLLFYINIILIRQQHHLISLMNAAYFNIPVILFLANALMYRSKKHRDAIESIRYSPSSKDINAPTANTNIKNQVVYITAGRESSNASNTPAFYPYPY